MKHEEVVRGVAHGVVAVCLVGTALLARSHDWLDVALVGLLGAFAAVTARKMTWKLRTNGDDPTVYSAWPDLASSSRVMLAVPISSSCSSNHTAQSASAWSLGSPARNCLGIRML